MKKIILWLFICTNVFSKETIISRTQTNEKLNHQEMKCVKLQRIDVAKTSILTQNDQELLFKEYLYNNCIDTNLLTNILNKINKFFMDNGYITTKAYLKEQNILDGQLDIEIMEGKIEFIVHKETNESSLKIATAFIFQQGNILNLRDLETSLEMINRPASIDTSFDIKPGTKQGQSNILIKTKKTSPVHLQLGLSGTKSLRDNNSNLIGNLTIDNLLNINDIFIFTYNGSRVQREYQSNDTKELNYSFPLGSYLFELIRSNASYKQGIDTINDTYLAKGNTIGSKIRISKVLNRNQKNKFELLGSIYHKDTKNYFADELIEVSSYKTSLVQLDLKHTFLEDFGQILTTLSYYQGKDWFGAREDEYYNKEIDYTTSATLEFEKYTFESSLIYYLKDRSYQFNSTFHLQYTKDHLFDNDKLTIGSDYTIRGYDSINLTGNNGYYFKNDLVNTFNINLTNPFLTSVSPFIGFDFGKIKCESDNESSCGDIHGMALGFKTSGKNLGTEFTWSRPLTSLNTIFKKKNRFRFDITFTF